MTGTDVKVLAYRVLKTKPVFSLSECFAASYGLPEPDGDINGGRDPIKEITMCFRACVYLCDADELAFLRYTAECEEEIIALDEIHLSKPFDIFHRNQFIYLFAYHGKYQVVLPRELAGIYREIIAEENFEAVNARNQDMSNYAAAMLNLYGACDAGRFMDVWNHHRKDKLTKGEALGFLRDKANFHFEFYLIGDCAVHDSLEEDEFEALREVTKSLSVYHMPTKSTIRAYSGNGYDRPEIPGQQEMDKFLAEYISDSQDLEDICLAIRICSERMISPEQIAEHLETVKAPLDDDAFRAGFELRYNRLRDAAHIWPLNGLTLYEYQQENDRGIPRFRLPELKKQARNKARRR